MAEITEPTWRIARDLACWHYALPMPGVHGQSLQGSYAFRVRGLLSLGGDFGTPRELRLSTRARGIDAWVFELDDRKALHDLGNVLTCVEDLEDAEISFTLHHEDPAVAGEQALPEGATVWLTLASERGDDVPWLRLRVVLHTDLHAARTWAVNRDNAAAAAHNAPRLERFLRRLESELDAHLVHIDAPSYEGQVYRHGFRLAGGEGVP